LQDKANSSSDESDVERPEDKGEQELLLNEDDSCSEGDFPYWSGDGIEEEDKESEEDEDDQSEEDKESEEDDGILTRSQRRMIVDQSDEDDQSDEQGEQGESEEDDQAEFFA
jgi:segregation and condensation protein B